MLLLPRIQKLPCHSGMRRPNSGLPEFGNIIVQVGNSRLGCAGPESILPVVVMDSGLARGACHRAGPEAGPVGSRPGMTAVNSRAPAVLIQPLCLPPRRHLSKFTEL